MFPNSVLLRRVLRFPIWYAVWDSLVATTSLQLSGAVSAVGTFLYVAFMEVLPRELNDPSHRLSKLGMLTLGFGLMSLLAIWA